MWDKGTPVRPEGPLAVPGKYKVVLKTGGTEYAQEFTVKPDPRVDIPEEDLNEQLEFALKIDSVLNKTTEMINDIDANLKKEKNNRSVSETDSLKSIKNKLSNINGALSNLASQVQTADAIPTQGAKEVFKEYSGQLNKLIKDEFNN